MKLRLDGIEVEAEGTLLELCRRHGIEVPTACHDPRLGAGGHCRLCMVEVDGRLEAACTTAARAGSEVRSESPRLRRYRRDLGELMRSEAAPRGRIGGLLAGWGVDGSRYARAPAAPRRDASHPLLEIDMDACIRCRLCEGVCAELQGQFVWAPTGRAAATTMDWGDGPFADSDCVACGACAAACPTAAITDRDRRGGAAPGARVVRSTCGYCGVGCQLDLTVAGDDIIRVDGAASPVNDGQLCVKGRYAHGFARHPDRLTTPLLRRGDGFVPIGWDEAIGIVTREFGRLRGRIAALSSSRCTNEENYLLQKWMRAGLGTNHVDCCARVCHAPSAVGMRRALGTGAATNAYADIERADLFFVCGSNTTESHPVLGARVKRAVLAGKARLVVIDPRRTELAALADIHLQPRPGSNVPLLNSLASVLVGEDLVDHDFLRMRVDGFDELSRFVEGSTPELLEDVTGVPAALVREAARLYAGAERPMQMHGLGVTEHYQGSEAVLLLCNLALLVGAVGREGVGVNPLRGQNNVQGAADMGCQPDFLPGYAPLVSEEVRARFEALWGCMLPAEPGLTIPRIYEAIDRGDVAGLFVLGEDIVATDPASDEVRRCLAKLDFLVVQELFLSETARLAHLVLPGASVFEKDGTFTNAERRVQRVRAALPPPGDARPDWKILLDLMRAGGVTVEHEDPAAIFDEIRAAWPALSGASLAALDGDGLQWPVTAAAPGGTPRLHLTSFPIGRAKLHCVDWVPSPEERSPEEPLLLLTGRVLEHYNSGSMTRRDEPRRLVDGDRLQMHPADAAERGIRDGDAVRLTSRYGRAEVRVRLSEDLRPGTLFLSFHFPESGTNRLVSHVVDRLTDCPEYKRVAVEVQRLPAAEA